MKCYSSINAITPISPPLACTIGTFDGVHRAHQQLLNRCQQVAPKTACFTFSNHPSSILQPENPTPLLTQPHQKQALMRRFGVNILIMVPFTHEFAQTPATDFLLSLRAKLPFSHLILGHDARIGYNRSGTPKLLEQLADQLNFTLEYLDPVTENDAPISSTQIRTLITQGNLRQAEKLLGRKVSFYSIVHRGAGQGRQIGFPTANLDISGLAIPPRGVYAISLLHRGKVYPGVANLGTAPTFHSNRTEMLEAHLFSFSDQLYEHEVEVILHQFIRPEQKFPSIDALRTQIQHDVTQARQLLGLA